MINNKKIILVTSGDPAGIGPDICLDIVRHNFSDKYKIVVIGSVEVLQQRAKLLNRQLLIKKIDDLAIDCKAGVLPVLNVECADKVIPGIVNPNNSPYVLKTLDLAISLC
ncbi:MAG: hypothetical protein KBD37_08910, partial [Burkholderiales bacterium]|nr:hypothetical protein [Burkholderiales bacterium]